MTLELNQVAAQLKTIGTSLAQQNSARSEATKEARALLQKFSTRYTALNDRLKQAEKVQKTLRFGWVGAAPTNEALAQAYPLPPCPERITVIASDGSQILPDSHAITLYYLINVGSIVYRHGSNQKPEPHNPKPILCYNQADLLDEFSNLISPGEIGAKRDLAEVEILTRLAPAYTRANTEPVVTLIDGQLTLRVIDLPFNRQKQYQAEYIEMLTNLQETQAIVAAYVDRPRSTFVLSLMHLASLKPEAITEETLRQNPFRTLTDLDLFNDLLKPGQRSAIFMTKTKAIEKYSQAGHPLYFFYLNVSQSAAPHLARIEIPGWVATNPHLLNDLHAVLVRQARLTGGYPYVLARADELAVISNEEREAVELMLAIEMRRHNLIPEMSLKQRNKNAFRAGKESFKL